MPKSMPMPHPPPSLQYDTDVVTWSPQGRIHQIEYAMEAVKQGAAAVGLKVRLQSKPETMPVITKHSVVVASHSTSPTTESRHSQSDTHVILASLKRAPSELSSYTQKVFKIDDHMGIATAGLAADGRILCRHMRNECINHR